MALAAGARLGPYEILGLIGAGAMGEVYRGRDTRLDRTVAIKILQDAQAQGLEKATFAGGCFCCMESPFEKLPGVKEVIAGYTGGYKLNPTYEEVSSGATGHLEAVQITFDPSR